ncbi:MAG: SDR family oxidoreductase [Saprospiraceae bacterium]
MNLDLTGHNALVCGSSKGIGKAAALEIAALGANVTLVARTAEKLSLLLKELDTSLGQQHDYLTADFSKPAVLKKKVNLLVAKKPIHILVNNTGGPAGGSITDADVNSFISAFQQHLVCNQILAQAVIGGMKSAGYGRIINVISTSVKEPISGLGVSNTTRGAVANWAKTWANEVGQYGVTVNNLLPGATATDRLQEIIDSRATKAGVPSETVADKMKASVPMNRFADPAEIGGVIAFLASPAAAYISGTNITVDGGRTKSW